MNDTTIKTMGTALTCLIALALFCHLWAVVIAVLALLGLGTVIHLLTRKS